MRAASPSDLAEVSARADPAGRHSCGASAVDQLLARLGEQARTEREQAQIRQVRETTAARQIEQRRLDIARQWLKARAQLVAEIVELDRALAPHGLSLSMGDDSAHPVDIAAVEIRLSRYGRPIESILDITITDGGEQQIHFVGGPRVPPPLTLPGIRKVKPAQYRAVLTAYLAHGYPAVEEITEAACRCCGRVFVQTHTDRRRKADSRALTAAQAISNRSTDRCG